MSSPQGPQPRANEPTGLPVAIALILALALALPAVAAEEPVGAAANWTVFLTSGSSIAATEVHYDKNQGRYTLKLSKGGYIHLSPAAVRRVSRDESDRIDKAEPLVASSTGSPRAGAVPGAIDASDLRPPGLRSTAASLEVDGTPLKDRAAARMSPVGSGVPGESPRGQRPANEDSFTPRRGMMEGMIKRANTAPQPNRR